jgi:23S rRNA (pseudouridine1915-N3)-methyltransferase
MKILLSTISSRRSGLTGPAADLLELYVRRSSKFTPCAHRNFGSEKELLTHSEELSARTRPALLLTDSQGQQLTSPEIANFLGSLQDNGIQQLIFAVGPADGWSAAALSRADKTIAFGRITLPHELAAVLAAEQLYRALTIRAGHPYHGGH